MKKFLKKIILSLIQLIEKFEYRNMDLDENDINKKIIDSIDISDEGISVLSHDGYHPVTHIHKTQPYQIYELQRRLESCGIEGHIIFEYDIVRLGKRIDVILLIKHMVFSLEFKNGKDIFLLEKKDRK